MPLFIVMSLVTLAFSAVGTVFVLAVRLVRFIVRILLGPLAPKLTQVHERNHEMLSRGSLQEVLSRRSAQMLGKGADRAGDIRDPDGRDEGISSSELTMDEGRHRRRCESGSWER